MLADGKSIREEIDIAILRNGLHEGSFGRYSSGEKARIILSSIIALQTIINSNSKSGGFGYLGLDEILESLDAIGLESIVKEFGVLGQNIDIITHGYHNIVGVPVITMLKKDGFTKIIE